MLISGANSVYGIRADEKAFGVKAAEKTKTEESTAATETDGQEKQGLREDSLEISLEGRLSAAGRQGAQMSAGAAAGESGSSGNPAELEGSGETDEDGLDTSEKTSGKVGVNEGKRARQIAAAKNRGQVQQVLALLQKDLADCKAGLEKGWCDESEIAKVEALINQAKARLSEVPQESSQEKSQSGLDEFAMASLM